MQHTWLLMYRELKQYIYITFWAIILSLKGGVIFAQNIINTGSECVQRVGTSDITFEMVKIPGSVYQMGTSNGSYNDAPLHAVQVDSLWVGKYEVTWELFELFLSENNILPDSFPQDKIKKADAITRPSPYQPLQVGFTDCQQKQNGNICAKGVSPMVFLQTNQARQANWVIMLGVTKTVTTATQKLVKSCQMPLDCLIYWAMWLNGLWISTMKIFIITKRIQ